MMTTRPLRESDIPALERMAEASGFPYPDLRSASLESVLVVVDGNDQPMMAAAAEVIHQMYLWCGPGNPHERLAALRLLHEEFSLCLKQRGLKSVEAFLPPAVSKRFSRRLERTFGWVRNWPSWNREV